MKNPSMNYGSEKCPSIFWSTEWVYENYYGWTLLIEQKNFKVLSKYVGPFQRLLILSKLSHDQLSISVNNLAIINPFSMIVIKDFSGSCQDANTMLEIGRYQFLRTDDAMRLFNKYTFAIDLFQSEQTLWSDMNSDNRRVCNKAIASGMCVECTYTPSGFLIDLFLKRYKKMANEKSLVMLSEKLIGNMFEDRRLTMHYARIGDDICSMILVYSVPSISFFMYGVSGNNRNDGSAQLLQWEVIQHLKKAGQHWYDFGGVPEVNEMNGIYRFKKSFGGEAVDLGAEYSYSSFFLQVVKFLYKKIRLLP
jgi:hypothetical protein